MFDLTAYLIALAALGGLAVIAWLYSVARRNVNIVDSLWSLKFLLAATVYAALTPSLSERAVLMLTLVTLWALRLAEHITWRNRGEGEDQRYQTIRRNNEPNFVFKSLYIVFGLQAMLAWIISLPLLAAIHGNAALGPLDIAGIGLWVVGMVFETLGDTQLARFKADPKNKGKVMDRGLWRYTRHPNYFGEACLWWGYFLIALSAGGWWSVVSPLLMTLLLLKVSGVALLEKTITERRPAYREYIARTPAFFPGLPRVPASRHGR
jgi:steroid 5-alpha reductase family enzyme